MAWTITPRWISPANWNANPDGSDSRRWRVQFVGTSDSTTELSLQQLIDVSELRTARGEAGGRLAITFLQYDISGLTNLSLRFDRSPDEVILNAGAIVNAIKYDPPLSDTGTSDDGTGDLLVSTSGATSSGRFLLDIEFRLKPARAPAAIVDGTAL